MMSSVMNKSFDIVCSVYQAFAHALLRDLTNYYWHKELEEIEQQLQQGKPEECVDSETNFSTNISSKEIKIYAKESVKSSEITAREEHNAGDVNIEDIEEQCKFELVKDDEEEKLFDDNCELHSEHPREFGDSTQQEVWKRPCLFEFSFDIPVRKLSNEEIVRTLPALYESKIDSLEENLSKSDTEDKRSGPCLMIEEIGDKYHPEGNSWFDCSTHVSELLGENEQPNSKSLVEDDLELSGCHPCILQHPLCYTQKVNLITNHKSDVKLPVENFLSQERSYETVHDKEKTKSDTFSSPFHSATFKENIGEKNLKKQTKFVKSPKKALVSKKKVNVFEIRKENTPTFTLSSPAPMKLANNNDENFKVATAEPATPMENTDDLSETASTCYNEGWLERRISKLTKERNRAVEQEQSCICSQEHGCLQSVEWDEVDNLVPCVQIDSVETASVSDWLYKPRPALCLQQQNPESLTNNTSKTQKEHDTEQAYVDQIEESAKMLFVDQWVNETQMFCSTHSPSYGCGDNKFYLDEN